MVLYFGIGKFLSVNTHKNVWATNVVVFLLEQCMKKSNMFKKIFLLFLLQIAIVGVSAQTREVVIDKGNYYSQAALMVDTIYNVTYEKDTVAVIVPRGEGIVYPSNEAMGQFITWMQGHPVYATPIVQYDSVAHRRNIAGDTLRIIFSNSTDALPQYEKEPIVWQHRQVTIIDSAQLLSAEQYRAIAQGGDTSQFIIEPTIIYTDTLYVRNIVDTVYKKTHEYVDLGLSVKWATCNVGAEKPEEYGDYFAWGEVAPKEKYDWKTYLYCKGTSITMTKYCGDSSFGYNGFTDNKTVLESEDDAATANWGGSWRMPTDAEMTELREKCTWKWTTQNGVNGYKVVGPNGNSIFLPAAGYMDAGTLYLAGSYGDYCSCSLSVSYSYDVYRIFFNLSFVLMYGNGDYPGRRYGLSVRPVCP